MSREAMKKYTWKEIKKESGIYKTFRKRLAEDDEDEIGNFNFYSVDEEIKVFDNIYEVPNDLWYDETFVKVAEIE